MIGRAYAFYFEQTAGRDPAGWPAPAREKYERYAAPLPDADTPAGMPAGLPDGLRLERRITWEPRGRKWSIGYLARRGRTRYLIFRGTAAEREWWKDFQLVQKDCTIQVGRHAPGRVHLGFQKIYATLDPSPAELARRISGRLVIAGHSLGAALATLAALELHRLRPTVYTLASPRVGDPVFAATYDALVPRTFRVANFWDPIVRRPDADTDLIIKQYSYRHVGREQLIYSLSQTGGESIPQLAAAGLDLASFVLEGGRFDPLFTHQLKCYEHGLRKL